MDNSPFEMQARVEGNGVSVIDLRGRLDVLTCKDLATHIQESVSSGARLIALDLAGLDYVSSAGLRVLLQARKQLKTLGGSLALCCAGPFVKEVLETTGFITIFPYFENASDAIAAHCQADSPGSE